MKRTKAHRRDPSILRLRVGRESVSRTTLLRTSTSPITIPRLYHIYLRQGSFHEGFMVSFLARDAAPEGATGLGRVGDGDGRATKA